MLSSFSKRIRNQFLVGAVALGCCSAAFGQGTFRSRGTPAPQTDASLPVEELGADDLISVNVYDAPELTGKFRVSPEGMITLPMLKRDLKVSGIYPSQAATVIADALRAEDIFVSPVVTVSVVEYRSRPIEVVGAVRRPTTFQATGNTTLLDALGVCEGLTDNAGSDILITRNEKGIGGVDKEITQRISVKLLMEAKDSDLNVPLHGGEQIRVPEAGRVYVVGNVRKPGAFQVHDADQTSVLRAVALSEGLLSYASETAYIYRTEGSADGKRNEIPVELHKIVLRKSPDVPLRGGDILYVPDRPGRRTMDAALKNVLMFGGGAATALIYSGVR